MSDSERVLFEIPIYSTSRKPFEKKFEKFIMKQIGSFSNDEQIVESIRNHYFLMGVWQFNQIIGYIQIVTTDSFFKILLWYGDKKRYGIDAKTKPMISCLDQRYVNYLNGSSNDDFQQLLREKVLSWNDTVLCKHRYIDIEAFDNLAPHVDFLGIIEAVKRET